MSDSKARPPRGAGPSNALDALLGDSATGHPIRRALWLDTLDRRLHAVLPPALAAHASLANVAGTRLVFTVDSPVWHAKMRLAADAVLDAARSIGLDVSEVTVKTVPPSRLPKAAAAPVRSVSATASNALRDALATLRESIEGSGNDAS